MTDRRWFLWLAFALLGMLGIFGTAYAQGDTTRGKQLYLQNCAVCHGEELRGRVGPALRKDFPGIRVDLFLKQTISVGVRGSVMPAWSKDNGGPLSDAEIDDIVAFIRSLGRPTLPINVTPPTDTPPPLPSPVATFPIGDAARGAKIYTENCAMCHGDRAQGHIGATLRKDWPGINPEAYIEATIARGVAGTKMPAWAQSNGGPLTNEQIADATAYIRSLKAAPPPTPAPSNIPTGGLYGNTTALVCAGLAIVFGLVVLGVGLSGRRRATKRK